MCCKEKTYQKDAARLMMKHKMCNLLGDSLNLDWNLDIEWFMLEITTFEIVVSFAICTKKLLYSIKLTQKLITATFFLGQIYNNIKIITILKFLF